MPKVNPDILIWARKTAGLTIEQAVEYLDIPDARGVIATERLRELESGKVLPSRPMLLKMTKAYRQPLLLFYLSKPPVKGNRGQDFRTLPLDYSASDDGLIDALIRNVLARQGLLRDALEDEEEEVKKLEFVNSVRINDNDKTTQILTLLKNILQIDHNDFYTQSDPNEAFTLLRSRVEEAGVFVLLIGDLGSYHTAIEVELFRGLALADDLVPFIVINDHDSHAAWSFTLLHELTHIILGQSGVSGAQGEQIVETFCNGIAGEFLLPIEEINKIEIKNLKVLDDAKNEITQFARERNLSSSMVAYKLYLQGLLDRFMWLQLKNIFRDRWLQNREDVITARKEKKGKGPSYYQVRGHRVGKRLINLVGRMLYGGGLTTTKAGQVLGVKAKNVQNLMDGIRPRRG